MSVPVQEQDNNFACAFCEAAAQYVKAALLNNETLDQMEVRGGCHLQV